MSECLVTNVKMQSQWSLLTVWSPSCHTTTVLPSHMIRTMPTWYCDSAGKVLQINCSASVFFLLVFLGGICYQSLWCCQGAISSRPMPSPAFGDWAPPFLLPPPLLNFMDGNPASPHSFLIFILFFFLSLCSTPLLSFSLCCVLISPTPLLCHQLGPLVSKSWSHCACVAIFSVFWITHMCMHGVLWHSTNAFIELILDMHSCTVAINSWLPLAGFWRNSGCVTSLLSKRGSRCSLVDMPKIKNLNWWRCSLDYHSFWCSGSRMNDIVEK